MKKLFILTSLLFSLILIVSFTQFKKNVQIKKENVIESTADYTIYKVGGICYLCTGCKPDGNGGMNCVECHPVTCPVVEQ